MTGLNVRGNLYLYLDIYMYIGFAKTCKHMRGKFMYKGGVHRQLLWISVGFYFSHCLVRRASYTYAKRDREMFEYIRHHLEDFKEANKKITAEVLESFHSIR
uniref:Uncharacterized protein n=1 Tax=Anolis carolinensis TaxID=28377 RepID=H9GIX9_ANOCA